MRNSTCFFNDMTISGPLTTSPRILTPPGLGLMVQLVVESKVELASYKSALERAGAVVHAVTKADDALSMAPLIDVDVLVCTTRLEPFDGFTLLRLMRKLNDGSGSFPSIALSTDNDDDEIDRAFRAGFTIHAIRPIDPRDLVEMVTGVGCPRPRREVYRA